MKPEIPPFSRANAQLRQTVASLTGRTSQLAAANFRLQKEMAQRHRVEESLRTSELTSRRLLEKSEQMREELRLLSRRLLTAQEEERKCISRELHDVIGQTLAGINLRLSALKAQSTASAKEWQRIISATQRLVEKSVALVHRFARELRPAVLDDLGLIPAIESYLAGFTAETGLPVEFAADPAVERQDSTVRTALYRVMQESLTNVAHHAGATLARVRVTSRRSALVMEVTDNGTGFQVQGAQAAAASTRLGLLGMRERVEMAGGVFSVRSAPGAATTIRAEFPLRPAKPRTQSSKSP